MKSLFSSFLLLIISCISCYCQPYYLTHIPNKYVEENVFIKMEIDTLTPTSFLNAKEKLPQPIWSCRQDAIKCYWKAWEIAFMNLHKVNPASGFISPFIDPAFNGHIFMWDSGFMLMFGRYGSNAFNFQNTLNNFYVKQHKDGFICREIRETDGTDCFERFDPSSTGPNILPWTEWEYYLNFNDSTRLKNVFAPLLAYYQWFQTNRSWPDGTYFSSGWGCGMDNQPRIPIGCNEWWSHGNMSWIDVTLQQIYAGKTIVKMANKLNRSNDVKDIEKDIVLLTEFINKNMWNDENAFYFDRFKDGSLSNVKSIASYWALLAGVVSEKNTTRFIQHLENKNEFARIHRVPTLSADHPKFDSNGGYWKGAVWAPTNYMVLRGLTNYGKDSLAFEIAINHLKNVTEVFNQTGTLWENYAPDKIQGNDTKNFVGWTGLTPISILFEYIFGIRPDVPNNTLVWDIRLTDEFGVKQYPFGVNGLINLYCNKRENETDKPSIIIESSIPFNLNLKWKNGNDVIKIKKGKNKI